MDSFDLLNNLEWYIGSDPKTAFNKLTNKQITTLELNTLLELSPDKIYDNVKIRLPLNNKYLYFETREIHSPCTIHELLNLIYEFYQEFLEASKMDYAFEEMDEWREIVINNYGGDVSQILKYDVFTDTCTPDFIGLVIDEETNEYFVNIGPE